MEPMKVWIASKYGFYSIVQKPVNNFQIRSRNIEDIENLLNITKIDAKIDEVSGIDYQCRIHVDQEDMLKAFIILGENINYSNFKDEVKKHEDQKNKIFAYYRIWEVLLSVNTKMGNMWNF